MAEITRVTSAQLGVRQVGKAGASVSFKRFEPVQNVRHFLVTSVFRVGRRTETSASGKLNVVVVITDVVWDHSMPKINPQVDVDGSIFPEGTSSLATIKSTTHSRIRGYESAARGRHSMGGHTKVEAGQGTWRTRHETVRYLP